MLADFLYVTVCEDRPFRVWKSALEENVVYATLFSVDEGRSERYVW